MPRFYIDTDDDGSLLVDADGHDLANAEASRRLALKALSEMTLSSLAFGDRRGYSVRIQDEGGTVLYAAELALTGEWFTSDPPPRSTQGGPDGA